MNLLTATLLFGPAAAAGPPLALAWWRHRGEYETALAILADIRARTTTPDPDQPPPGGGIPAPADSGDVADVIDLNTRRRNQAA